MCFSPVASFTAAAVTAAIGVACLARTSRPRERAFAAMPLVFAVQQVVEGFLWLTLPAVPESTAAGRLTLLFLVVAEAIWPVYAPIAVMLIEPDRRRRRLMAPLLALGAAVSAYLLSGLSAQLYGAYISGGHIVYINHQQHPIAVAAAYIAAVAAPLLLSTHRTVVLLGAIVLAGWAVTYLFYWEAFISVWCFFAAVASVVVLTHFQLARLRLKIA